MDAIVKNVKVGEYFQDVDGFYYFLPNIQGSFPAYVLKLLAEDLDDLNKEWEEKLERGFSPNDSPN